MLFLHGFPEFWWVQEQQQQTAGLEGCVCSVACYVGHVFKKQSKATGQTTSFPQSFGFISRVHLVPSFRLTGPSFCSSKSAEQSDFFAASLTRKQQLEASYWCEEQNECVTVQWRAGTHRRVDLNRCQRESEEEQKHVVHRGKPLVLLSVLLLKVPDYAKFILPVVFSK